MTTQDTIRSAAAKAAVAHVALVRAMIEARANGMSLRAIADAAGMSHEHVRRLTQ